MTTVVSHPIYGEIVYNEDFWFGKKTLTVNGSRAMPLSKNIFMINDKKAIMKGNFITGVSLWIEGETIELAPKTSPYELAIAIVPFAVLFIWGMVPELCAIIPALSGAIGFVLYAFGAILSISFMRRKQEPIQKILIGLAIFAAVALVSIGLASLLVAAIVSILS